MGQHHTSTAVPFEAKSVEGITFRKAVVLKKRQVRLPLVTNDFATRKTAHGDNHSGRACKFWALKTSAMSLKALKLNLKAW